MLGLLLEAVAGEMPAGAEEEPPEACPRCGCPPHRQEGPRRRRGAKEALPRVRPQLPGVDGAGARHHQAARGDLGALRRGDARGRHAARRRRRVRRLAQDQLLDAPPPLRGDGVDAAGLRGGPGLPGGGRRGARARLAFGQPLEVGGFSMPRPARRRGGDGAAAGVSSDKVSVLTMVNARGDAMAVAACRGKMGVADARRAMAGCALEGAVVSTDRQRGYVRALAEMGVAAHERFASSGPRAPLKRVNALHSALKAFLARFRGVSTRRLPNSTSRGSAGRARRAGAGTPPRCCGRRWGRGHTGRAGAGSGGSRTRSTRRFPCHRRVNTASVNKLRKCIFLEVKKYSVDGAVLYVVRYITCFGIVNISSGSTSVATS